MTAAALSNELRGILTRGSVDDPVSDSSLIMQKALGCTRAQLVARFNEEVGDDAAGAAVSMARRRAAGEPIQYILGEWSFMGRGYRVGKGVLIPRDDTEVVVRAAMESIKNVLSPAAVDLCSGSGIIAITLKKAFPNSTVYAVEKSKEAFRYLESNISRNSADVRALLADLCECAGDFADGSLDLIISNPPYVKSKDIAALQREIAFEPRLALDGGESGFDFYELIISLWSHKLRQGGVIALELGEGQFGYVSALLRENGYTNIIGHSDIQSITRAVTASRL